MLLDRSVEACLLLALSDWCVNPKWYSHPFISPTQHFHQSNGCSFCDLMRKRLSIFLEVSRVFGICTKFCFWVISSTFSKFVCLVWEVSFVGYISINLSCRIPFKACYFDMITHCICYVSKCDCFRYNLAWLICLICDWVYSCCVAMSTRYSSCCLCFWSIQYQYEYKF